jgi:Zn finger protein HypA/HybF involved in hydrogenase expression
MGPTGASIDGLGMDTLHTTAAFANINTQQTTSGLTECLICPECETINNVGWLFCPQCGKKVDNSFLRTMELSDQAPTIAATLFPDRAIVQNSFQPALPKEGSSDMSPDGGSRDNAPSIPPDGDQLSIAPQQHGPDQTSIELQREGPDQWPILVQPQSEALSTQEQLEGQPLEYVRPDENSNGAGKPEPNVPVVSVGQHTLACSECGSPNNADYYFCHSCGASLPVTKTIVMSSIGNPVKPRLRLLLPGGESGPTYEIRNETRIGRTEGSITFPQDAFMSSSHARIVKRGPDYILIDETSSNGTFLKVKREAKLEAGDVILAGGQLLRFEP